MTRTFSLLISCTVEADSLDGAERHLLNLLPWTALEAVDATLCRATAHDDAGRSARELTRRP